MNTKPADKPADLLAQKLTHATEAELLSCIDLTAGDPAVLRRMRRAATAELRARAKARAAAATDEALAATVLAGEHVPESDLLANLEGIEALCELERRHPAAVDACLEWEAAHPDVELTWFESARMLVEAVRGPAR